ncbi:MAG: glycerate dehydrogenase, partial [Burkholderia sp.]|nr:glycerate dehydrogenase [Burkholderia sp.]
MFSVSSPAKIVFLDRATLSPQTVMKPFPFPHVMQTFDRTAA